MKKTPMNNRGISVRRNDEDEDNDNLYGYHDIKVVGDHVWFYAPITPASSLKLNAILQDLSMRLAPTAFSSMHEVGQPSPIWLHINSYGGEVFSAFAMADTIQRISAIIPIVTIVEGCAASGATFASIAGTKRLMRKNAFMLVHELRNGGWGKYSELKDEMTNNLNIMKAIKDWYKENTKIPEKEMDSILSKDIWWNAKTCLKYGLIDQII
jgi:ATP-dependent Clp protease protease subunit